MYVCTSINDFVFVVDLLHRKLIHHSMLKTDIFEWIFHSLKLLDDAVQNNNQPSTNRKNEFKDKSQKMGEALNTDSCTEEQLDNKYMPVLNSQNKN
jgi:hypothetical protein